MSVGKPAGSSSKALLRTHSQKIHHFCFYGFLTVYLSYVASIYVMYLCSIFFQAIRHENAPNTGSDGVQIL